MESLKYLQQAVMKFLITHPTYLTVSPLNYLFRYLFSLYLCLTMFYVTYQQGIDF